MLPSCNFLLIEAREEKTNDFKKGALLHKSILKTIKKNISFDCVDKLEFGN